MSPQVPPRTTPPSRGAPLRLEPGERVLWAGPASRGRKTGLLVCTALREAWVRAGFFGAHRREWRSDRIDRVEVKEATGGQATVLLWARRGAAFRMAERDAKALSAAVAAARAKAPFQAPVPAGAAGRPAKGMPPQAAARSRLERIERLRRQGTLTDAEFQA
ncbi:MAG TPA: hypothetical protein VHI93_05275, partial [Candidatus Thermoplasmatota archaeon]|nr:hypothetical protein [Candidatus Thermoplasmatota archaeon]